MNKSSKFLLAALVSLAPAALQAQTLPSTLTDGVQETDASLFANIFNLPADGVVDPTIDGDPTGATLNQFNVGSGGLLSANNSPFNFTEINILSGGDTSNSITFENAEINVFGGEVGSILTFGANSTLNTSPGSIVGSNIDLNAGATANLDGATVSDNFDTFVGSTLNISGTTVFSGSNSDFDGDVNISGGTISGSTDFNENSNVTISGGTFGNNIDFFGANNTFSGGSFGSNFDIEASAVNTVFDVDGSGNGVTIASGAEFFAGVTINGGDFTASADFEAGTTSVINGGNFGNNVDVLGDVTVNDGTFGTNLDVESAGVLTVNGGTFDFIDVNGGVVNLAGGNASNNIDVRDDGTLNISGGFFESAGILAAFGDVNLSGSEFFIDNVAIDGAAINVNEGAVLTGLLDDGSSVEFDLFLDGVVVDFFQTRDFFNTGSLTAGGTTINILAVPEPSSLSLLALGALGMITRRKRS